MTLLTLSPVELIPEKYYIVFTFPSLAFRSFRLHRADEDQLVRSTGGCLERFCHYFFFEILYLPSHYYYFSMWYILLYTKNTLFSANVIDERKSSKQR